MDEKSRALQRRWRETGTPADWAAWLRAGARSGELPAAAAGLAERVAAGVVTHDAVRQAAYLGDPVALAADGYEAVAHAAAVASDGAVRVLLGERDVTADDVGAWIGGLATFGRTAPVAALAAIARRALEGLVAALDEPLGDPDPYALDDRPRTVDDVTEGLRVVDGWLACPCANHAEAAGWAADATLMDFRHEHVFGAIAARQALRAAQHAHRWPAWPDVFSRGAEVVALANRERLTAETPADMADAVRSRLVPALLGVEPDPQ